MPRLTLATQHVLAALLQDPTEARYGLDIARQAGLPSGTLYPILARLEAAGWVESAWEIIDPVAEGRRPRRYYHLTGEGERVARTALHQTLRRLTPGVNAS
jgi:DNA-binding PadR family transcriptional regulator